MAIRRRPDNVTDLRCDRCGHPAAWRTRVVSSCCVLGEVLCDTCESDSDHTRWWHQNDTFWRDVVGDLVWLTKKIFR